MINSYSNLTIGEYDRIRAVLLNDDLTNQQKDIGILSVLTGQSPSDLLALPFEEVSAMLSEATFLRITPKFKCPKTIDYKGFTFNTGITLTYAQYIDLEHCGETYTELLRVILVPKGHTYNDGYEIDFQDLSYVFAKPILDSFLNGLTTSSVNSLRSLRRSLKRSRSKTCRQTISSLDAILHSLSSLGFQI